MPDYLDKNEDERFTETVIYFNGLEAGNEKSLLWKDIESRVSILLYEIPIRALFLSHSDAADLFLSCVGEINVIVSGFRVALCTFNEYLKQVCRHRMKNLNRKRKNEDISYLSAINDACSELREDGGFYASYFDHGGNNYHGIARPAIYDMGLTELIEFISSNRDGTTILYTEEEDELHCLMESKAQRKKLLIFLLSFPDDIEDGIVNAISRVLELDSSVMYRFMELRYDLYDDTRLEMQEFRSKAGKHWLVMAKLKYAITLETDEEKRDQLTKRYWKVAEYHKNNIDKARCIKPKSKSFLSEKLSLSRSSISLACRTMTRELMDIQG